MATNLSTYLTQVQRLLHDANNVIWQQPELTDYINTARDQTCRDTQCLRILQTGFFQQQTESYQYGALTGLSITAGGGSYTLPPLITFSVAGQTTPATATTTITAGVVTGTTITAIGAGFTSTPTVTVTNAPGDVTGSGAAISAGVILSTTLDVNNVTIIYGSTRYQLGWMPFSEFTAYMRPWTNWFQRPMKWSDYAGAQSIYIGPNPDQVYPFELDTFITPNVLVDATTLEQINSAHQLPIRYYAAYLAKMRQQAYGEADWFKDRYIKEAQLVANQVFTRRIPEPYGAMRSW